MTQPSPSDNSNCFQLRPGALPPRTLPGVGVSSQRFRRDGVAPSERPGVASQRLPAPGVASHRPGVASVAGPGVASHRLTEGVASTASQSDTFAFFLQQHDAAASVNLQRVCCAEAWGRGTNGAHTDN